jgi:hypothetical protein
VRKILIALTTLVLTAGAIWGANLQLLWRYEEFFYPANGWGSGFVTREGSAGLSQVEIKK